MVNDVTMRLAFRMGGIIDSGGSSESLNELGWNAVGAGCIIAYYAVASALLFFFIERIGWYKVNAEDQSRGLDMIKHDAEAYFYGNSRFSRMFGWPCQVATETMSLF